MRMLINLSQRLVGLALMLVILPGYALQILPLTDNAMANVNISQDTLNRLGVIGERIKRIKGLEGQYQLKEDDEVGEVYLKPLIKTSVINIFLTTEKGKTFQLQLKPSKLPAQTILIQPLSEEIKLAMEENKDNEEEKLIRFIEIMAHTANISLPVATAKTQQITPQVTMTQIGNLAEKLLQGQAYLLKNTSQTPVKLMSDLFVNDHTRAVALQTVDLQAGQTTIMYKVIDNE